MKRSLMVYKIPLKKPIEDGRPQIPAFLLQTPAYPCLGIVIPFNLL
jgi:hypothetical protein